MAAPTFVTSYSSAYTSGTSPKTLTVTTQAGDVLVVYGGIENGSRTLSTPSGNSISFTQQQAATNDVNWASAYVWTGTDSTGGTNWTLSCSTSGGTLQWGFSCLVFRASDGVGASNKDMQNGLAPSVSVTTTQDNSALVVFNADWNAVDGSSRTWSTINSITPTSGNGLERDYARSASVWTGYGAYYNDVGTAGSKTGGLTAPGGQKYSIVAVEVKGSAAGNGPVVAAPWISIV